MTTAAPAIRERPILFQAPMVHALLTGTKSQTRRIVKLPRWVKTSADRRDAMRCLARQSPVLGLTKRGPCDGARTWRCPYGVPGDRLWVRETWWEVCAADGPPTVEPGNDLSRSGAFYRADHPHSPPCPHYTPRPSIHMPRWASRISLEIADVRVQRLQEISHVDAVAEGWPGYEKHDPGGELVYNERGAIAATGDGDDACIEWYAGLWESINGAGSWDANPWVWALTFKRLTA